MKGVGLASHLQHVCEQAWIPAVCRYVQSVSLGFSSAAPQEG